MHLSLPGKINGFLRLLHGEKFSKVAARLGTHLCNGKIRKLSQSLHGLGGFFMTEKASTLTVKTSIKDSFKSFFSFNSSQTFWTAPNTIG